MTKTAEMYLCVYVPEFLAQALSRLRPELDGEPCVVMEGEPPSEQVCSIHRRARALGVQHGMSRVEVEAFPAVTMLARSEREEEAARSALLDCVGSFTPRVEDCSEPNAFLCVLDIVGTEKLFGPPATLAQTLLNRARDLRIHACAAVSGNFHAAIALAKGITSPARVEVMAAGDESAVLAPLPLGVLNLSTEQAETFARWGIRTLGMLAALPEVELIARMGQQGKRLRQSARGHLPHLFRPAEAPFPLRETMEFDAPVESLDALLFAVNRMLEQLILRANARILALVSVSLTLRLHRRANHVRTVRPALPTDDRQLWLKLLHLDLEAHPPQAAILAVTLEAEPGRTGKVQLGLFAPQTPEPSRLDLTLARIRAIVGEEQVGRPVLKDAQRPGAFHVEPFRIRPARPSDAPHTAIRPALRRLRPRETISVALEDNRPAAFVFRERCYTIESAYGPWFGDGDWWSATRWSSEQWDLIARSPQNSLFCCCIEREPASTAWTMAALYD